MACNTKKVSNTCGSINYAVCTKYESEVNSQSELSGEDCLDLEQTTQDIYGQLEDIQNAQDLSELGSLCLSYTQEEGKTIVKNVLKKYEEEICALKSEVATLQTTAICEMSVLDCGLDLSCLSLPCDTSIVTVKDLFQALINKVCI